MAVGPEQPANADDLVIAGNDALGRGAWREARDLFEQALRHEETPEALEGLGRACWWLDDAKAVGEVRERAYRAYRERGDAHGAARLALSLAEDALIFRAEEAVWSGWTERARRLLADLDPSPEHALLATREAFYSLLLGGDVDAARRHAEEAIALAKRLGTFDLEMLARAVNGAARVAGGQVAEGMRLLDEATTAATSGEMRDIELIGLTCCWMIFGCERVRDFPRAAQWCERVADFCQRHGLTSLLGTCRTNYAMVLTASGDSSSMLPCSE